MAQPSKKVMSDVRPRSMDGMVRKAPASAVRQSSPVTSRPGDIVRPAQTAEPAQAETLQAEAVEQPVKPAKPKKPLGRRMLRWFITVLILLLVVAIAAGVWIIYVNFFR